LDPGVNQDVVLSLEPGLDQGLDAGVWIWVWIQVWTQVWSWIWIRGLDLVLDLDLVSNSFPLEPPSVLVMLPKLSSVPPLVSDAILEPLVAGDLSKNLWPAREGSLAHLFRREGEEALSVAANVGYGSLSVVQWLSQVSSSAPDSARNSPPAMGFSNDPTLL
jgi:hypothetical protein